MVRLRKIGESLRDYFFHPRTLERDAKAAIETSLYSPTKDEARIVKITSELEKSERRVSELLLEMTKVAMRLHLFYSKKRSSKAEELSLSMANTLRNTLERARSGKLNLVRREKSLVKAIAEYWDSAASIARSVKSTKQETASKEKVESYIREGRHEEALTDLQTVLEAQRKASDKAGMAATLRNIAEVMRKKGDLEGSLDYFQKAANIDSRAWFDVGLILGEMNRFKESITAYEKYLKNVPQSAPAWNNMGWTYENLQNFSKALECYEKALTFDKQFISSWIGKSWILWKQGKLEQAINGYEEILKIDPANQPVLINLTALYNDGLHEYEKAVEYAQRALSVNPSDLSARSNLAEALVPASRYKEARNHAKKILQLDDDPSRKLAMYFTISSSYFLEGKVKEGTEYLNTLMGYRASLPQTFTNHWVYDGISNLITGSSIQEDYRTKLLEAIRSIGRST